MLLKQEEFCALSDEQKSSYVTRHGVYLAYRWHANYGIDLYWLDSFYCELWLEQDCLEPECYRTYACRCCLEPYTPFLHLPYY